MSNRHRAREIALQILYGHDLSALSGRISTPQTLLAELNRHFEHFQVPENLREFTTELVAGTVRDIPTIDPILEKHAENWKVSRMAAIDRNLLRMACYELKHFMDIPHSVTLDEAIELAKQFGNAESSGFINGILDSIRKELPEKPVKSSSV